LVESIQSKTSLVRLVGANAIDQAAGMAMSRAISVDPPATMIELSAWCR
jgi:hypothetical protein